VLAGGAALGAVYSDAGGLDMALMAAAVALLFVFAALLVRVGIWTLVKYEYPGRWFYNTRESVLIIAVFVLLLAAAIPAWLDYRVRKSVEASVADAAPARRLIENYFAGNRSFPGSIDAKTLRYDRKSGALTVLLHDGPVEGKSVVLTPAPTGFGALSWTCRTVDVPERYLPAACR